jgi:hypothetical protein
VHINKINEIEAPGLILGPWTIINKIALKLSGCSLISTILRSVTYEYASSHAIFPGAILSTKYYIYFPKKK